MKKIIESIKKRILKWNEECKERRDLSRYIRLDAQVREIIQVMEFNGELFISANGVPLFKVDNLSLPLTDAIANVRQVYKEWQEEKLWEHKGATRDFIIL